MHPTTRFWLAVGTSENWHTAFDYGPIWGLRPSQEGYWEAMAENNDLVFFYVTSPVSGVVGYGIVRTKLKQDSPKWPEERAKNQVIWPLRFEFDVISCLPPDLWRDQKFSLKELKARARSGFQEVEPVLAQQMLRELPASAPDGLIMTQPIGLRALTPELAAEGIPSTTADLHHRTQGLLVEIGRMQRFVADVEFPLENRRVDVVWRRVQRSVPSFVFEVQVGGNLTEAFAKLKQAFDLWNSNIFLVGRLEHQPGFNQLATGSFHEIQGRLRFIEVGQVEELYHRKRAYREFEGQLGMLG